MNKSLFNQLNKLFEDQPEPKLNLKRRDKMNENKSALRLIFKHQRNMHKAIKAKKLPYAAHCLDNMKSFMFFYNDSSKNPVSHDQLSSEINKIPLFK